MSSFKICYRLNGSCRTCKLFFRLKIHIDTENINSYQQGVQYFNQSVFTQAGFSNDTMARLTEIYQNENGHLAIFENAIPDGAVSPIIL